MKLAFITGFAFSDYDNAAALLVNGIKENGQTSLIPFMAKEMLSVWPEEFKSAILVPVPSSRANAKRRGFSHTTLLARALVRGLPNSRVRELLVSAKPRRDQVGLSTSERKSNMTGAFKVQLAGLASAIGPIVLIDDVLSSGASLTQAELALRERGLKVSSFCVFARSGAKKQINTGQMSQG